MAWLQNLITIKPYCCGVSAKAQTYRGIAWNANNDKVTMNDLACLQSCSSLSSLSGWTR